MLPQKGAFFALLIGTFLNRKKGTFFALLKRSLQTEKKEPFSRFKVLFGKMRNGSKADNIDVKIFSPESLKCPPLTKMPSINKKGNNFACCSMNNKCRKLVFLLFSSSRVDLCVKKQNFRNLSLIE